MLRGALVAALVVGMNAAAVSAVAAGLQGLWGALLGLLMVIVFSGPDCSRCTFRGPLPADAARVAMASYTGRIAIFGGLLALAISSDAWPGT